MAERFEASARRLLEKYDIPNGDSRQVFIALGAALDRKQEPLELIVLQRAYLELHRAIDEIYRPRTPLQAQLEHVRTRNQALDELGMDIGEWDASWADVRPICPNDGAVLRTATGALTCPLCDYTQGA